MGNIKKAVTGSSTSNFGGMRQELMRMPKSHQQSTNGKYVAKDNDDFISSESDTQMLLIRLTSSIAQIRGHSFDKFTYLNVFSVISGNKMKSWMS